MTVYRTEFRRGSVTGSPLGLRARNQTPRTAQGRGHLWLDQSGVLKTTVGASGARRTGVVGSSALQGVSISGIQPYHYWDFMTDKAWFAGVGINGVANTPGWSFTRASVGSAEAAGGALVSFASGQPRRTDRGLLIEPTRTNLFLNSAVGVTQGVTVTNAQHTLSFRGTGRITLSGASTAGPLYGAGANTRVSLTFTPSAGTLTLTVSGSVTNVNLELGSAPSSWIETAGASVTRADDYAFVSSPGVTFPLSMWLEYERAVDPPSATALLRLDDGTTPERVLLGINGSTVARTLVVDDNVIGADVTIAGTIRVNTIYQHAGVFSADRVQGCINGTLGVEDTAATMPATPTAIRFGASEIATNNAYAYFRRAAIFNTALSDAQLQAITS